MAKISEWTPQISMYEPSVARPHISLCNGSSNKNSTQWGKFLKEENKVNLSFYELICYNRYKNEPWYNKTLKNGWPGVNHEVHLGRPIVNRFKEIIVITLKNNKYPEVHVLGILPK